MSKNDVLPFRLDEGLFLENENGLIPWGTRIDELANMFSPEVLNRPNSVHYFWRSSRWFGGMSGDANANRSFRKLSPTDYHSGLDTFHCASFRWWGIPIWSRDEIAQEYSSIYEHLRIHFGEASWCYPRYPDRLQGDQPAIFWEFPKLTVNLTAEFPGHLKTHRRHENLGISGAYFSMAVTHEPDGYDELKAEAQAIRLVDGDGARVNGVVWE